MGCQPALTDRLGQPRICQKRAAARLWRYDFRHDAIAVRDQDVFATSGEADIYAENPRRVFISGQKRGVFGITQA
jgi:hypothetical protein